MNRYSGQQAELFERFRAVGEREVAPGVPQHDAAHAFDREAWRRVGASGLFGLHVKRELGGDGLTLQEWAAAIEGFAVGSADLGFSVSIVAHAGCLITALQALGTEEQQRRYIPPLMSGAWVGAVANSEPRGGTDVMSIRSHAKPTPSGFVLSARKRSITNVGPADLVLTSAKVTGADQKQLINIFCVPGQHPRVWQQPIRDLMGLRTSPTGNFVAHRTVLPGDALLGKPGDGVRFFRMVFSLERLLIGYLYLASIERSLERAVQHAETRMAFGDVIGKNQYVQDKVVRMRTSRELLSAQLDRTLDAFMNDQDVFGALSIIKSYGVEAARESAEDLIGLLGARGLRQTESAQKDYRDLTGLSILGGTQELQKIIIYRETVKALNAKPATPAIPNRPEVTTEIRSFADVDRSLESALITLAQRAIPGEAALQTKYYYDSVPDYVIVARVQSQVVGTRVIIRRTILLGDTPVRVAGIGIAVDPDFQKSGIGKRLTKEAVELIRALGDDLVLAFLVTRNAESLLTSFGFRRLNAEVSYTQRASNERVIEQMPCFAMATDSSSAVLDEIEARGKLHLGLGTW